MNTTEIRSTHYEYPLVTWPATLLGAAVAFVMAIMLNVLGAALGIAALASGQTASAADAGIASVIWVSVSNLIALGIGAWIAARSAPNPDYHSGTLQGVAVWAVTSLVVLILATSSISGAAGSLMRTAGNVAGASSEAVTDNMSEGDLEAQARRIQAQAQAAAGRANEALDRNSGAVREVAEDAAAVTAAGAFGLFLSMLLGLIAAVIGARMGARHPVWDTRPRHAGSQYRNDRNDRHEIDRTERRGIKE